MKISIVTTCLNSEKSIAFTLSSVFSQTYKNIEHIIIDGGSTDETLNILKKHNVKKKIFIKKNTSIYEALNIGITKSSGQYILVLNSDDILNDNNVIKNVVNFIKKNNHKIILGNVTYFNNFLFNKPTRFYTATNFKKWMFYFGLMPPHPGSFIHKSIAKKYSYNPSYKIAADYDFFLKSIKIYNTPYLVMPLTVTRMRTGGVSGINIKAHITSGREIYKSLKKNGLFSSHFLINLRYFSKLKQFFFKQESKFQFLINDKYKKLIKYHFKVINNIQTINYKKNFVLSALNLAFLGAYMDNKIKLYKELIHWPDGVFIKHINISIKKIPGRKILEKIQIPNKIKKIVVFGSLPIVSKRFLISKFQRKINHIDLPFGNIEKIIKNFKYDIKKNEFILITLPTPKQEQLAEYLISKNKNFKILCIGGSINILSGLEKEVPKYLYPVEFIWRLRYETIRRSQRLISTFFIYLKGKYLDKKLVNLNIRIIKKT
jgi:glycosyltransferase involved in cell wall biosynthesis|tara:strand:+ start:4089 stop:5552 length:1464 start_codon:yes stop_codon:yes gene_type:complete